MSSPDHNYHRDQNHQSIPLRDLHRPPDDPYGAGGYTEGGAQQHRRTLSDRGRDILSNVRRHSGALATGNHWNPQYSPIAEASPSPTRTGPRPHVDTAVAPRSHAPDDDDDDSPVDMAAFQAATGFSGLSFQGETSPPIPTPMSSEHSFVEQYGSDPYPRRSPSADNGFFSPTGYDDTARLHFRPWAADCEHPSAAPSFAQHMQDRSSFQSVRFLSPSASPGPPAAVPVHRLGDDIGHAETATAGLRTSTGRKRSLSPGGFEAPLHRAGTIMRNMSQRVVNISNEPEVAERTLYRKSALHARLQEPPSFPALPEYLHDGTSSPSSPVEKPPSPLNPKRPSAPWQAPPNPLRGKTLGIIPPNNKLRMKLCDVLVHPVTEPLLLVLIIVQTVLLAVDARESVFEKPRTEEWGSPVDWALLGLFIVYTVEAIIRIIVSGFIINPIEYSTINRQVGMREAVLGNARRLFAPQRQPSLRRPETNADPQQPSVLRTFTTAQMNPAVGPGDSRDQQRARLAHRAYLRHSFNRTDFVAVVAYWIAFAISITSVETKHHIYIFKMLSCLRIIRLLNLTSGTSVRLLPRSYLRLLTM
jgi:hypothetical protein